MTDDDINPFATDQYVTVSHRRLTIFAVQCFMCGWVPMFIAWLVK